MHCSVLLVDRNTQYLNMACDLADGVQNDTYARITMYYRFNGNVYRKFLIDLNADFCEFMLSGTQNPLFSAAVKTLASMSNIIHPCPHTGQMVVRNLTITNRFVAGGILPAGQYRSDINIYNYKLNQTIVHPIVYFTVPNSNDARLDLTMG